MTYFLINKKQYWGKVGDILYVDTLNKEIGEKIVFKEILSHEEKIGTPLLSNIEVICEVLKQGKNKKIHVIKMIPQKRHRKRTGFRKKYTQLKIIDIKS